MLFLILCTNVISNNAISQFDISGCYHDVSDEHLQSYIDEACFRWNTRKISESERFTQMFVTSIGLIKPNSEFILCNAA